MENTLATLEGLRKEVYGDKLQQLVPECSILGKMIPMQPADQSPGKTFNLPVKLTRAHGWTLNGTAGGAYALNASEPARSQNASLSPSSFTMEERIGYDEVALLMKSKGEGQKRAFVNATSYMLENMVETAAYVRELQLLWGQENVGVIESVDDNGDGTGSIVITKATHIAAMLAGLENGFIDVFDTTGVTQRNAANDIQITSYDFALRKVFYSGATAETAAILATDTIYLRGTKTTGMVGLMSIASNVGTLFTIDGSPTGFSLWSGNTQPVTGTLVYSKVLRALNLPSQKAGFYGEACMLVHPMTWTDMMNDLSAMRRDSVKQGGTLQIGSNSLTFATHTGSIEIIPHLFQKPGEAVIFPKNKAKRIGPYDVTFQIPGGNLNFFENLGGNAGYAVRNYWLQALFLPRPAECVRITGIVNSDDA